MSENTSNNTDSPIHQPPAGWYPDPQNAAGQRYWDGARWTEHAAAPSADAAATVATSSGSPVAAPLAGGAGGDAVAVPRRGLRRLKWWQWALIALGVIVLISIIVNSVASGRGSTAADSPASTAEPAEIVAVEPEPVDARQQVPGLVGLTVAEARAALEAGGFVIAMPAGTGDDWLVATQTLSEGRKADAGTEVFVTAEAPKPAYTLAQQNAIRKAQSYLDFSGFSRAGLIGQLEYEGFSTEDATFGADNAGADWNAEAAEKAASYLEFTSFSREGLYGQLAYEGFTDAEIQFGLAAVGY